MVLVTTWFWWNRCLNKKMHRHYPRRKTEVLPVVPLENNTLRTFPNVLPLIYSCQREKAQKWIILEGGGGCKTTVYIISKISINKKPKTNLTKTMKDEIKFSKMGNWETAQNKSVISARIMQPRTTGAGEGGKHSHARTHPHTPRHTQKSKNFFWPPYTIILSIPDLKALRAVDYILCVYIYICTYIIHMYFPRISKLKEHLWQYLNCLIGAVVLQNNDITKMVFQINSCLLWT